RRADRQRLEEVARELHLSKSVVLKQGCPWLPYEERPGLAKPLLKASALTSARAAARLLPLFVLPWKVQDDPGCSRLRDFRSGATAVEYWLGGSPCPRAAPPRWRIGPPPRGFPSPVPSEFRASFRPRLVERGFRPHRD